MTDPDVSIFQHSLKAPVSCSGIGLHSGRRVTLTLTPAAPCSGLVFHRSDRTVDIPASWDRVVDTRLCTVLGAEDGTTIGTVEHLLAALYAAGIDNARITLDGPEVPIMDGSAAPFLTMIRQAQPLRQDGKRRCLEIRKPVTVAEDGSTASLSPSARTVFSTDIAFDAASIGRQSAVFVLDCDAFGETIGPARTFCLKRDIDSMRAAGLIRGGSLDNALVFDGDRVVNAGGLRFADEPARHKLLDAIGDIALCGGRLLGRFDGVRSGHRLNNLLLRALFADKSAYRWRDMPLAAPQTKHAA